MIEENGVIYIIVCPISLHTEPSVAFPYLSRMKMTQLMTTATKQ
jgi:hypothetical protein